MRETHAVHVAGITEGLPSAVVPVAAVNRMGINALERVVVQSAKEFTAPVVKLCQQGILGWPGQPGEVAPGHPVKLPESAGVQASELSSLPAPADPLDPREPLKMGEARAVRSAGVDPGGPRQEVDDVLVRADLRRRPVARVVWRGRSAPPPPGACDAASIPAARVGAPGRFGAPVGSPRPGRRLSPPGRVPLSW